MRRLHKIVVALLIPLGATAQKNAPVIGDAANLMDLLRKNYATLPEADRRTALEKDRAMVIGIFKSYLEDEQVDSLENRMKKMRELKCKCAVEVKHKKVESDTCCTGSPILIAKLRDLRASLKAQYDQSLVMMQGNNQVHDTSPLFRLPADLVRVDRAIEVEVARRDTAVFAELENVYQTNVYVKQVLGQFKTKYTRLQQSEVDAYGGVDHASNVQKALPFLGGELDFQMLAEGLSKFLAKRLKEELTTHVITQVKQWLEEDTLITVELKVLLPRTTRYLLAFRADQLTNFTQEVRQFIEDDLDHMLENAAGLQNTRRLKPLMEKYPDIAFALEALELIPKLSGLKEPTDYFDLIEGSANLQRWAEYGPDKLKTGPDMIRHDLAHGMRMAALLARSMVVIENGQEKFAGPAILNAYKGDVAFFKLYMGFLYQQTARYYADLKFVGKGHLDFTLKEELSVAMQDANIKGFAKLFNNMVTRLGNDVEALQMGADQIRKANKLDKHVGADTVHAFVGRIIDFTESLVFAADTFKLFLAECTNHSSTCKTITLKIAQLDTSLGKLQNVDSVVVAGQRTAVTGIVNQTDWIAAQKALVGLKPNFNDSSSAQGELYRRTTAAVDSLVKRAQKLNAELKDTTLWLRAQARNYHMVARRSNDIILDLRQEKYASGILKCLDLAADLVPAQPVAKAAVASANLTKLDVHTVAKDWRRVRAALDVKDNGKNVFAVRVSKSTAKRVKNVMSYLGHMYDLAEADTVAAKKISWMRDQLFQLDTKREASYTEDPKELLAAMKDSKVSNFYFAYLSNLHVDSLLASAKNLERDVSDALQADLRSHSQEAIKQLVAGNAQAAETGLTGAGRLIMAVADRAPQRTHPSSHRQVLKIVYLMNDLAEADSSDDVANAIEAFALPAGSFAIKRAAVFNVSLNAYPGMLGGWGFADREYSGGVLSFTAPVGFSTTWRTSFPTFSRGKKAASFGFFIPLIDVGAVTRLQLNGSEGLAPLPELKWANLFAPGLYLHYGSPKNPISFHAGWQSGPQLKSISTDANGVETAKTLTGSMIALGIVVDIPIWNLYTKPYMK